MRLFSFFFLITSLFFISANAQSDSTARIFMQVYGSMTTACIEKQLATTGNNRLGTAMSSGRRYLIYCHDGAGAGAACKCLQGGTSVDVTGAVGNVMTAGEKRIIRVDLGSTQLSCQSFSGTPYVHACPLD